MANITAIVIGNSQQGKSTLISKLLNIPSIPVKNATSEDILATDRIVVGDGDIEVTTEAKMYTREVHRKKHWFEYENKKVYGRLYNDKNKNVYENIVSDATKRGCTTSKYLTEKTDIKVGYHEAGISRVSLLDTPGLDGTKTDDEVHIETIIKMLSTHKDLMINAVIFVTKYTSNYGARFINTFRYYHKALEGLADRFIIVQTAFTSVHMLTNEREKGVRLHNRENQFRACVSQDGGPVVELKHHFVDMVVDPEDDGWYHVYRLNTDIEYLLHTIENMQPKRLGNISYYKTASMISLDIVVRASIAHKINSANRQLENATLKCDKGIQDARKLSAKLQKLIIMQEKLSSLSTNTMPDEIAYVNGFLQLVVQLNTADKCNKEISKCKRLLIACTRAKCKTLDRVMSFVDRDFMTLEEMMTLRHVYKLGDTDRIIEHICNL